MVWNVLLNKLKSFGDRCSPMSSSAALVSILTGTNLFINIKNRLYSSVIPFILSLGFYYEFSRLDPLMIINSNLTSEILKTFKIDYLVLVPVLVILMLCLCKIIHLVPHTAKTLRGVEKLKAYIFSKINNVCQMMIAMPSI